MGAREGVSPLHLFTGAIGSDSGLALGWWDVVTRAQDSCLGWDIGSTLRPEIFFCAVVGIIITELNICDYEIVGRLESRFTQMIPPQNTAFFFCQKA